MRTPEHILAAFNEAEKFGAAFEWAITNGNHIVGIISLHGKAKKVFFSKTPSRDSAQWDARRNVRRAIGGM